MTDIQFRQLEALEGRYFWYCGILYKIRGVTRRHLLVYSKPYGAAKDWEKIGSLFDLEQFLLGLGYGGVIKLVSKEMEPFLQLKYGI